MVAEQPRSEMRVGHHDREQTVAQLQQAAAEGYLDDAEFDQRLERALTARVVGDLTALTRDLPRAGSRLGAPVTPELGGSGIPALPAPGYHPDRPLRLAARGQGEMRKGRWVVPPYLELQRNYGYLNLDCTEATASTEVVHVHVSPGGTGSIEIIIPNSWGANLDQLRKGWGYVECDVSMLPQPGGVQLVLTGGGGVGSLCVRHANRYERWRRRRRDERRRIEAG